MSVFPSDCRHPSLQDVFVRFADTLFVSLISQNLQPELFISFRRLMELHLLIFVFRCRPQNGTLKVLWTWLWAFYPNICLFAVFADHSQPWTSHLPRWNSNDNEKPIKKNKKKKKFSLSADLWLTAAFLLQTGDVSFISYCAFPMMPARCFFLLQFGRVGLHKNAQNEILIFSEIFALTCRSFD